MFARHLRDGLLKTVCDNPSLSAYSSRSGKELSVILINKDRRMPTSVELQFANFTPRSRAKLWVLNEKQKYVQLPDIATLSDKFSVKIPPYSIMALEVIDRDSLVPPRDIASPATPTASSYSTIGPHFKPASATDGKLYTRWNSAAWTKSNGQEEQWFQLSWKTPQTIKHVKITWGETYAMQYQLTASPDGKKWTTIRVVKNGSGGIEEFDFVPVEACILRMEGKKGTKGISAYSIREISVFGE
jgi:hypothetical protein